MKHMIIVILIVLLIAWYLTRPSYSEGFNIIHPPNTYPSADAHGCAPAGVNASPGAPQYEQNSASPPVNPANKLGNKQNVFPEYKKQP
jgi:hypothetical protein